MPQEGAPARQCDVVVVGAGPYGLSTAAHLQERGLKVTVFGKPLNFWREHMPQGMFLRSYWWATNLSDPHNKYGLAQYFRAENQHESDPLPIEAFIEYGLWFQKHVVPNVDETYVETIECKEGQFVVRLTDGRVVESPAVVMAPGLAYYAYRPTEYSHIAAPFISHTFDHQTFDRFRGRQVVVVGGGQSALETAALLYECGADVQLVTRSPLVWLSGDPMKDLIFLRRLQYPKAGIAYGWFPWGLEHFPYAFQRLPRSAKERLLRGRGRYGPAGAHWLKDRVPGKVTLHELQRVQAMKELDNGVRLTLSNGKQLWSTHVILATGYRVDIKNLPMLHPSLSSKIETYQNAPVLNNRFESSVPGLYFLGLSSVSSCGPLFRFVVGTEAAAKRVAGALAQRVAHAR
jgi:thioredoxin reductase